MLKLIKVIFLFSLLRLGKSDYWDEEDNSYNDEWNDKVHEDVTTFLVLILVSVFGGIIFVVVTGCIACYCLGKGFFRNRRRHRGGVIIQQPGQPTGKASGSTSQYPPAQYPPAQYPPAQYLPAQYPPAAPGAYPPPGVTIPPPYTATDYSPQYKK